MCCQSVTCQVAVTECSEDAQGCAGKTPGQDGWVRVSAGLCVCGVRVPEELGVGPGGRGGSLKPEVLCVGLSQEGGDIHE